MGHPLVPPPPGPSDPKKSSRSTRVVVIVVTIVLALCCVGGAAGGFVLYRILGDEIVPARQAGERYIDDMRAGDYSAAYAQLCSSTRNRLTEQEYLAAQQAPPKVTGLEVTGIHVSNINGRQQATLTVRISYDNGEVRTHGLPMVKEAGTWRPCP